MSRYLREMYRSQTGAEPILAKHKKNRSPYTNEYVEWLEKKNNELQLIINLKQKKHEIT